MWSGGAPRGYLTDSFRFFGRFNFTDLPLIRILPVAIIVLVVIGFILYWFMHRTNLGRMIHAIGDNPRAAILAGVPVNRVRITAFVVSSLSAVAAGIMLGGFAGVSTDVGIGYELQAITAAVLGGAQLLGGRGSVPAAIAGALTLNAIFTLLNFLGLAPAGAAGGPGAHSHRRRGRGHVPAQTYGAIDARIGIRAATGGNPTARRD